MKKELKLVSMMLVLLFCAIPTVAQEEVYIKNILETPQRYYNLKVLIKGEIVDVSPASQVGQRGHYLVIDNSDKSIKVVANDLPAPGKKFSIVGVVQVETSSQRAFIREVSRIPFGGPPPPPEKSGIDPLILGLGGLILMVVIILLVVVFKKPQTPSAPIQTPAPAGSPAAPAPAAPESKKTQQVSTQEVLSRVGAPKTTQVPSVLAQLIVKTGELTGKSFPLKYETTIGRETGDIILSDSSVSRSHAAINYVKDKYVLENLSDTNPVVLNGQKVPAKKELKDGDEILCGFIKMVFKLI